MGTVHRTRVRVLALALAALVAPSAAVAKTGDEPVEILELVNDPGDGMVTDRVWTAEIRVQPPDLLQRMGAEAEPSVLIIDERTGEQRSFPVRRSGDRFVAEVVFPEEGRWAYGVATGGRLVAGREYVEVTKARTRSDATPILILSGLLLLGALALSVSALRHRGPVADPSPSG